ncbi:hypothetical protein DERP_005794 [Dermatophagoides pteronyssinus]|uniref:Uncharacterized protein n=1 Tax=Dermatophagoides pteronyssinus TaxID=6956 RepID=A0ABQ8J9J9_DERPT|nr:hypothetical protein DERP_005794 [Dermatophagoides pteronyssinus]
MITNDDVTFCLNLGFCCEPWLSIAICNLTKKITFYPNLNPASLNKGQFYFWSIYLYPTLINTGHSE